jgi:hypothetical protein
MVHLKQVLNLKDDSFTYFVGDEPLYRVDCHAGLTRKGVGIGHFKLRDDQWHLYLGDELYMSSPNDYAFNLPEFELEVLTELANQTARPQLAA